MKKQFLLLVVLSSVFYKQSHASGLETWTQIHSHRFGIVRSVLRSQGIANDGQGHFWYSSTQALLRANSRFGLAQWTHLLPIPAPLTKLHDNHIGDIDYADGKIYAPIEDGPNYKNPYVGVFNAHSLEIEKFFRLPVEQQRDGVPWVAVDIKTQHVFSSEYSNVTRINVYSMDELQPVGYIPLSQKMESIQGAKVYDGAMYITANNNAGPGFSIFKIDLQTGVVEKIIDFPSSLVEVEGLTLIPTKEGFTIDALGVVPEMKSVHITRRMVLFTFKRN